MSRVGWTRRLLRREKRISRRGQNHRAHAPLPASVNRCLIPGRLGRCERPSSCPSRGDRGGLLASSSFASISTSPFRSTGLDSSRSAPPRSKEVFASRLGLTGAWLARSASVARRPPFASCGEPPIVCEPEPERDPREPEPEGAPESAVSERLRLGESCANRVALGETGDRLASLEMRRGEPLACEWTSLVIV